MYENFNINVNFSKKYDRNGSITFKKLIILKVIKMHCEISSIYIQFEVINNQNMSKVYVNMQYKN